MLKRLAKHIVNELKTLPSEEVSHKVYDDDCNEVTLDERLNEFRLIVESNTEQTFRCIDSFRSKLDAVCLIVDALNEKKVDEVNFMDMVKELTYKINAYEKYRDYKKMPDNEPGFDPLNQRISSECETQTQSAAESN